MPETPDKPTTPQSEEAVFEMALQKTGAERAAFLASLADESLRKRIESLLAAHHQQTGFLPEDASSESAPTVMDASRLKEGVGAIIGQYKLLEKLGEGGFGAVWAAEQREPVRRRVALKIIKLGMDTRQVVARFEAERQALALMDHPNIAKVLDAGATDTGRPYFVMELVKGIPITKYCDQEKLSVEARLDLFIKVCHAIQHAHQKGIIHRDIKPSNIMVTLHDGVPVPKVIDFGIAKATQQELTEKTIYTQYSQFIGTPAYMSPEQAELSGLDIDTRSDIYSLGVLLYELLTGSTPFDTKELMQSGLDEMRKIIREREPVRPSTRLSQLTSASASSSPSVRRPCSLASDLDWIVIKCLEKDRARRYDTANGLVMDLRRHLENEPVGARPPSALYKFQKAWKRNKLVYSASMAISAALVVGIALSLWQAQLARRESKAAELARIAEHQQKLASEREAARANAAEKGETQLRLEAESQGLAARRRAYAGDMLLCQQALTANNLRRARLLLDRHRPTGDEVDLRGWEWRYLWKRCKGDASIKLDVTGEYFRNTVFTSDDKGAVSLSVDGKLTRWDLVSRKADSLLPQTRGSFNRSRLCVSNDGEWIAATSRSRNAGWAVRIWDSDNYTVQSELTVATNPICCVTLSPDRETLAVLVRHEGVRLWDIGGRKKTTEFPIQKASRGDLGTVLYSPDGKLLAIGEESGKVRLIDVKTSQETAAFRAARDGVVSLAFSPDSKVLAVGHAFVHSLITLWAVEDKELIGPLKGHLGFIASLAFSPDGKFLASASADQTIKVWDTSTWEEEATLLGHSDEVWSVTYSKDGQRLLSCGKDGSVCVWPAPDKSRSRHSIRLPEGIGRLDVSPDGKTVAAISSRDGTVQWWDRATMQEKVVPLDLGRDNRAVFWVSSEEIILGTAYPPRIKSWNLVNNTLSTFQLNPEGYNPDYLFLPHSRILIAVVRDPASRSGTITRWDLRSRRELSSYTLPDGFFVDFSEWTFSQDGKWFSVAHRTMVQIRSLLTGEQRYAFKAQENPVQGMALFSDGQRLITAGTEAAMVNVWDLPTQRKTSSIQGHNLVNRDIVISPDGQRMATSSIGQEPMKLWDTDSWEEVANLSGPPGWWLTSPRFLSDGNSIAALEHSFDSQGRTVRLWQAPSWDEIKAAEAER